MRRFLACLAVLACCATLAAPAKAADVVYPKGLRVGLVPLDGLVAATTFSGFENPDNGTKMLVAELPAAAFTSIETSLKAAQHGTGDAPKPENFETAAGKAYLNHQSVVEGGSKIERFALVVAGEALSGYVVVEVPEKAAEAYTEPAIRKMLASTAMRAEVPLAEQLSILPFKVTNLADFKKVRIIPPGAAVTLSDAESEVLDLAGPPYVVISVAPIAPDRTEDRDRIARDLVETLPGIKNVRITNAESMRIGGSAGYEVRLEATTAKDDKPISVVQWLRFGSVATLRIVGGATREDWPKAFPRFRAVRDGIDPPS